MTSGLPQDRPPLCHIKLSNVRIKINVRDKQSTKDCDFKHQTHILHARACMNDLGTDYSQMAAS